MWISPGMWGHSKVLLLSVNLLCPIFLNMNLLHPVLLDMDVASCPSEHKLAVSHPSASGHDPDHSRCSDHPAVPEMMALRGHNTDSNFVYLYNKDKIYRGGAPVSGWPLAVEHLTLYCHQSEKKFHSIPPFHCVPRMDDDHNEHALELESLLWLVDSGPSESDFSKTRQQERRKNG